MPAFQQKNSFDFKTQYDLGLDPQDDEIVVDFFCGGGGAGTGLEMGLGRPVDVAKNHSPAAISMHTANHPHARHFTTDVFGGMPRPARWLVPHEPRLHTSQPGCWRPATQARDPELVMDRPEVGRQEKATGHQPGEREANPAMGTADRKARQGNWPRRHLGPGPTPHQAQEQDQPRGRDRRVCAGIEPAPGARSKAQGPNVETLRGAARGSGLPGGMARDKGLRLRSTNQPGTAVHDCPLRWSANRVAGADPREESKEGPAEVAHRRRVH